MKLIDIANTIDKSKKNEDWIDLYELGREFDLDVPYTDQERLKSYWFGNWYCTDTIVGYKMYFFDDKPVAFSYQKGRKWDEELSWFSENAANDVKAYLVTLLEAKDDELNISLVDINKEIGDSYKIEFNAQLLGTKPAKLNGVPVEITKKYNDHPYRIDTQVTIKRPTGEEQDVSIRDLDFSFFVNKPVEPDPQTQPPV